MSLLFEDVYSWITMDSKALEMYSVERLKANSFTCWIASESGRKFSVNWRNTTRAFPLQGRVSIDGVLCDIHIMLDAMGYPDRPDAVGVSYARTSECTRRDFMFTALGITDDDAYLHTLDRPCNFGTIKLELWRLHVESVVQQPLHHQPREVLEGQIVHERSKKAGTHQVKYGKEYYSPAPVADIVTAHTIDPNPYVTFTFKYRPIAMLMAGGIIPRTMDLRAEKIRILEAKINALRSKVESVTAPLPFRKKIKIEQHDVVAPSRRTHGHNRPNEIVDLTEDVKLINQDTTI